MRPWCGLDVTLMWPWCGPDAALMWAGAWRFRWPSDWAGLWFPAGPWPDPVLPDRRGVHLPLRPGQPLGELQAGVHLVRLTWGGRHRVAHPREVPSVHTHRTSAHTHTHSHTHTHTHTVRQLTHTHTHTHTHRTSAHGTHTPQPPTIATHTHTHAHTHTHTRTHAHTHLTRLQTLYVMTVQCILFSHKAVLPGLHTLNKHTSTQSCTGTGHLLASNVVFLCLFSPFFLSLSLSHSLSISLSLPLSLILSLSLSLSGGTAETEGRQACEECK